jgi:hypothetical protein
MAKCTKCSAELIGSAKFCATCGSPVVSGEPAIDLAATAPANANLADQVSIAPKDPYEASAPVNPFAATASPTSKAQLPPERKDAPEGGSHSRPPPPADGASAISPLAVSNALSQRGAFQQAVESAMDKARASQAPPAAKKKAPGTQMMQNAPNRPPAAAAKVPPSPGSEASPAAPAKKAPPRTVAMNFNVAKGLMPGGSGAPQSVAPSSVAQPQPSSVIAPAHAQPPSVIAPSHAQPSSVIAPSHAQPPSVVHPGPSSVIHGAQPSVPAAPYNPPPYGQQAAYAPTPPAQGQGNWGWNAPAAQAPHSQYGGGGFAYAPGARVQVTWSNGQRYPATVSQVSGTQCLVVFPDGQQHWVEMQYLARG